MQRIGKKRRLQRRRAGTVELTHSQNVRDVHTTNREFDVAGRQTEQRSVNLAALLIDPVPLVHLTDTGNVAEGCRRVALEGARITKEVEIGNVRRLGPGRTTAAKSQHPTR